MNGKPLKEVLLAKVDDIEALVKRVCYALVYPDDLAKNENYPERQTNITDLVTLFVEISKELEDDVKKIPDYQARERYIRALTGILLERNQVINEVSTVLRTAQRAIMQITFDYNAALRSLKLAEMRLVESEEVVKYAHQISRHYSVSAPANWGIGNPQRPFPTDNEFRLSQLANPQQTSSANLTNPTRPNVNANVSTPPAVMQSPIVAGVLAPTSNRDSSPVPRVGLPNISPRGRPIGNARGSESSPMANRRGYDSPSSSPNPVNINIQGSVPRPQLTTVADVGEMSGSEDDGESSNPSSSESNEDGQS